MAFTLTQGHDDIQPRLQLRPMSASVALVKPGSVLVFMAYVTTKNCENA